MQQCPPSGAVPRTQTAPAPLPRSPFWIDERAQIIEPISRHHASRNQFPQRSLDLRLQLPRPAHNVGKERRPAQLQKLEHKLCPMTESATRVRVPHFSQLLGE